MNLDLRVPVHSFDAYKDGSVLCFAWYYDIKYGHLLEGEKQMGIIINTCKEFNLHPLPKGYLVISDYTHGVNEQQEPEDSHSHSVPMNCKRTTEMSIHNR